jgi:hypothetical protein
MHFKELEFEGVFCIHLNKDKCNWRSIVNAVLGLRIP